MSNIVYILPPPPHPHPHPFRVSAITSNISLSVLHPPCSLPNFFVDFFRLVDNLYTGSQLAAGVMNVAVSVSVQLPGAEFGAVAAGLLYD